MRLTKSRENVDLPVPLLPAMRMRRAPESTLSSSGAKYARVSSHDGGTSSAWRFPVDVSTGWKENPLYWLVGVDDIVQILLNVGHNLPILSIDE